MIAFSKTARALLASALCLTIASCSDDTALADLAFVGDSLVARWDVQASFPSAVVSNYGVSGSGIEYLESLAGRMAGRDVVVISGTNDVWRLESDPESLAPAYAERYVAALEALGADRVYLYSIFPRGKQHNGERLNPIICLLNSRIRALLPLSGCRVEYIDCYDALQREGLLNPNYTLDGLHLNVYGYEVVAAQLNF